jgi:hypothetical protein
MNTLGLGKINAFGLGVPYPGTGPTQPPTSDLVVELMHDLLYDLVIEVQSPEIRGPEDDGRRRN